MTGMSVGTDVLAGLDAVDAMAPEARRAVHLYGLEVVNVFLTAGVKPAVIERLIEASIRGGKSMGNNALRGGTRRVESRLDEALTLLGAPFPAAFLLRYLREAGFVLVPRDPPPMMVEASIAETGKLGLVSKAQKHKARLRAANLRFEEYATQLAAEHLENQRGRA
jgi:hypothetical protein